MAFHYLATAQPPTAVTAAVTGAFTGPDHINLVVAKCFSLEIYVVTPDGLKLVLETRLYGRVGALELFRAPNQPVGWLLIATERYQICILSYNAATGELVTVAGGSTKNDVGKPLPVGFQVKVDPLARLIGVHQYVGMFKVLPIDKRGQLSDPCVMRLDETNVISTAFVHNASIPMLAVLYQDSKDERHLKFYEVDAAEATLRRSSWASVDVEPEAHQLFALPAPLASGIGGGAGGVVVVGSHTILVVKGAHKRSIPLPTATHVTAVGAIDRDGRRWLLGDNQGGLHMLLVRAGPEGDVSELQLQRLGETSTAFALCYLDNGFVYVGSRTGDSQLVRLVASAGAGADPVHDSQVQVLETYPNLGPITDLCVIDPERQGQGQLVTCSGLGKEGSLRIVRSGVGINEHAVLELPGIKGIWPLRASLTDPTDSLLAVSFVGETRFLAMEGEELAGADIPGFASNEQTVACGNVLNDQLVQVTASAVRLVSAATRTLQHQWTPPAPLRITVAALTPSQVLVATGSGHLVYLQVEGNQLVERGHATLEHEIACIDAQGTARGVTASTLCAVGLWTDMSVRLLELPSLKQLSKDVLGGVSWKRATETISRSILIAPFPHQLYLLVGLGDGQLYSFTIAAGTGALENKKRVSLGTQPVSLTPFYQQEALQVFAASDRPTVVHASHGRLFYSNVNVRDVAYVCPLNAAAFPNSLAIADDAGLTLGTIDHLQKLHIRTVPLRETPRRVAHQEGTTTVAVLTVATAVGADGVEVETERVRLFSNQTFEAHDVYTLPDFEKGCSIASVAFGHEPTPYYVVGTALMAANEDIPSQGRILVFSVSENRQLRLVSELAVKGAVMGLDSSQGHLVAAINSSVHIYKWQAAEAGGFELSRVVGFDWGLILLSLRVRGEFVLVGDLMKSICLLRFNSEAQTLTELARDKNAAWTTAVELLDDDTFIAAENDLNMFVARKNAEAVNVEDQKRLDITGLVHVGDLVNCFRTGSLVMRPPENELAQLPSLLFGTVGGMIGVVMTLPAAKYNLLRRVQENLTHIIHGVGGFTHSEWRRFVVQDTRHADMAGFVDGDLVERFLSLPAPAMEAVVRGDNGGQALDVPVDALIKTIEELARLH